MVTERKTVTVDPRRTISMLSWTTGVLFVAAVAVPILAVVWPLESPAESSPSSPGPKPAFSSTSGPSPGSDSKEALRFDAVWGLDLRRPLFDGAAVNVASRPPLAVKLAGTILEPGRSQAMFTVPGAGGPTTEFKGVGDKVGGAEVVEITATTATVLYYGERVVLRAESGGPS